MPGSKYPMTQAWESSVCFDPCFSTDALASFIKITSTFLPVPFENSTVVYVSVEDPLK